MSRRSLYQLPLPLPLGLTGRKLKRWLAGLLSLLVLLFLWNSIFIPIGSGHLGVLWSRFGGGTVMDRTYGEGYRVIWPWDRMAVYDARLQEMHGKVTALTIDGLQISLDITARFAPRAGDLPRLHRYVGPGYRNTVVWPDVVAALRHLIRQFKPKELSVLGESALAAKVNAAATESVAVHWVDLDRVLITDITFPQQLQEAIQDKLVQEQKVLSYDFLLKQAELERQRRSIEAKGIREFESIAQVPILKWRGVEATERLAASPNSKIVVIGPGETQLPVLLNADK
jgi:regulator of protease activity HflC (stomatin/prohibitin superfamily)